MNICGKMSLNGSRSNLCNSINYICYRYGMNKYNLPNVDCKRLIRILNVSDASDSIEYNLVLAGAIKDAIFLRDCKNHPLFSYDEFNIFIEYLCTE